MRLGPSFGPKEEMEIGQDDATFARQNCQFGSQNCLMMDLFRKRRCFKFLRKKTRLDKKGSLIGHTVLNDLDNRYHVLYGKLIDVQIESQHMS